MKRLEMPPTIFGIETEVPAAIVPPGSQTFRGLEPRTIETLLGYTDQGVLPGVRAVGRGANRYLSNGWRTYIDADNIMEFSSGEATTIDEAVTQDVAMERTIYQLFCEGHRRGLFDGFAVNYRALMVNRDPWGKLSLVTSLGRHQNFGFPRGNVDVTPEALTTFGVQAALRPLLLGTGAVLLPDAMRAVCAETERVSGDTVFSRSQKMPVVYCDYSSATMSKRPLVNSRDRSYASSEYVRIHDASSEHTPSPWAKRMGLGMGQLALLLTHFDMPFPEAALHTMGPLHAFGRALSFDMKHPDSFASGEVTKQAVAHSRTLLALGKKLAERVELTDDVHWTMAEWTRALNDFETDPRLLRDRTDWVYKKLALNKFIRDGRGRTWGDRALEAKDRQWDDMGPKGIAGQLRAKSWAYAMPTEAAITQAQCYPVQTTRARVRGALVRAIAASNMRTYGGWDFLTVVKFGAQLDMEDPHWVGPDAIDAYAHKTVRALRLSRSVTEYARQQAKAGDRRARNERRARSRPRR